MKTFKKPGENTWVVPKGVQMIEIRAGEGGGGGGGGCNATGGAGAQGFVQIRY